MTRRLLAALLLVPLAAAAPLPDAASIAARIQASGAKQTVHDLSASGQWDALTDHIGRGESAWIALAPLLAAGTDAGTSEGLGIALATALPKNPRAVLRAVRRDDYSAVGVRRVCGIPFIEPPPGVDEAYRVRAVLAVAHVAAPGLAAIRDTCLQRLRS